MLLDLTAMSPEQSISLVNFLKEQFVTSTRSTWRAGITYAYGSMNELEMSFKQTLIRRESKAQEDIAEGNTSLANNFRYEVVSNTLIGKGKFGSVYSILSTFTLDNENKILFKTKHPRVVKLISKLDLGSRAISAEYEYTLTKTAGHLGVKKPITQENTQYLVLKHIPGCSLATLLDDVKNGRIALSLEQRLQLSKALLKAYQEQVLAKNIIHRDLKPANILVNLIDPITVTIIDYGLSADANDPTAKLNLGTPVYMAPEALQNETCFKSDIFSIARTLGLIWNNHSKYYTFNHIYDLKKFLRDIHYNELFIGIEDLSFDNKNTIREILMAMSLPVKDRISIEDAIRRFDNVVLTRNTSDNSSIPTDNEQQDLNARQTAPTSSSSFFRPAPPDPISQLLENILAGTEELKATENEVKNAGNIALANKIYYVSNQIIDKTHTLKTYTQTKCINSIKSYLVECVYLLSSLLKTDKELVNKPYLKLIAKALEQLSQIQNEHHLSLGTP